jgi:hypothetical protein
MQADVARGYDAKASKLIGIHAFVHPTEALLDEAKLDFDLLTRNSKNPMDIRVNNWINERETYVLSAPERIKQAKENTEPSIKPAQPSFQVVSVSQPVSNLASTEPLKTAAFDASKYVLVKEFSARYRVYKDRQSYYCYDKYWPFVRQVPLAEWPQQQLKDPLDFFGAAFLPANLGGDVLQVADDFEHVKDWRFWQHPCRTEQDAAAVHKLLPAFYKEGNTIHVYVAVPWASLIDKEVPLQKLQAVLGLIGARIKSAQNFVQEAGGVLKIHTVCQHVFWARLGPHAKALGITDFYISHKEKGKDTQEGFEGIALHPWSLYAVNYREDDRNINFVYKDIQDRDVFASFTGAYMPHYISNVRQNLQTLSGLPGYHVKIKDQWHFNDVVYKYQVKTDQEYKNSDNLKQTVQYNELMSKSVFSLCPSGAGPNSLRFWECLANGSIPVVLADTLEFPNLQALFPQLPLQWQDAVVFHAEKDLQSLDARLRALSKEQLVRMQAAGLAIYKQCESMTCFGKAVRLIKPNAQQITKEALQSQVGAESNIKPPEYPCEKLVLIKNQQLHIDGQTMPMLTGRDTPSPIAIDLKSGESVGTVWFDATEKVYAINLYGSKDLLDGLSYKLQSIYKFGKYQKFEFYNPVRLSDEHIQLFVDDSSSSGYLSMGLRFDLKCKTPQDKPLTIDFDILPHWMKYKLEYYDKMGTLAAMSELNSERKDDLFDTENIENGRILTLIEQAKDKYKLKETTTQLFPQLPKRTENLVGEPIQEGISFYVHLMNRNENVQKNLKNWLTQNMDELILLDWSSKEPVADIPGVFDDPRVRVVRVEGQTTFIRTLAQNLATQMSRYTKVFKCDSDVEFKGDFFKNHPLNQGEFWVGDWHQGRDFNERHLHGETYYHIDDFFRVAGYDERILAYGHDDTNLKDRMVLSGVVKKVFSYNYLLHQFHEQKSRSDNQVMIHPMVRTYQNRFLTNENSIWSNYELPTIPEPIFISEKIVKLKKKIKIEIDVEKYEEKAINQVASWYLSEKELAQTNQKIKIKKIWEMQIE